MDDLIAKASRDLLNAKYAIALTGAGMSTESGVPDFRGPNGIWTKDPEAEQRAYETYPTFQRDPEQYWIERLTIPSWLGTLGNYDPNPGHYALAEMEKMGILKTLITQNIDNFHRRAGSRNLLEYHGNAFMLRCTRCDARFNNEEYDLDMLLAEKRLPPQCKSCGGVVKMDVVHFQEPIPAGVARQSAEEARKCDFMLICGTSAVVYPFAQLPYIARSGERRGSLPVTIVEVNAEPTGLTQEHISDYLIRGKTGEILPAITAKLKELRKSQ